MSLLPPLVTELVSFGCDSYPAVARQWPEHLHSFHQFDAILSGEVFLGAEGRAPFRLRRGDALLTPPMVRHAHRTRKGFCVGLFKFHLAPRFWPLLGSKSFQVKLSPAALQSIEYAQRVWSEKSPLRNHMATSALTICLVEAARAAPDATKSHESTATPDAFRAQLWRLLERVENNPYRAWTVAGLAADCHLTPDHFAKRFREALAQAPLEYLLRARMRAAAHELATDPDLPIKEVAAASGYATVHAFTRAFRRVVGASPARFRRTPSEL
ncbi:MAG: helix-turn-helix domain-containing protein [Planctomycetes bacterium]|nr:helix-turn-helix domain-containing protein [Planctomycetota bacterium]